jgi:hypothetical protein
MVQSYTSDCFAAAHVAQTDLQNMENNDNTLRSHHSGAAQPANPVTGMQWFETDNKIMKYRNAANDGWIGVMHGSTEQKIPVYRNDAMDGWVIDDTVTDCVVALKTTGGGLAYDVAAGAVAGTWTQPGHVLASSEMPAHDHGSTGAHNHSARYYTGPGGSAAIDKRTVGSYDTLDQSMISNGGAHTHASVGDDESHNHGTDYRPRAALCTLQFLDMV